MLCIISINDKTQHCNEIGSGRGGGGWGALKGMIDDKLHFTLIDTHICVISNSAISHASQRKQLLCSTVSCNCYQHA